MTAIRGWAGLSQGAPSYRNILSSSEPRGKLAEAARPSLDPATPQTRRTNAGVSGSRPSYPLRELGQSKRPVPWPTRLRLEPISRWADSFLSLAQLPYMRAAIEP